MDSSHVVNQEELLKSIVDIAVEAWRFRRVFEKAMQKMEINDRKKYLSQFAWFTKKIDAALENANLRTVNLKGELYDVGMAVSAVNIDEFEPDDRLFVAQMLEPIIMDSTSIIKIGTVVLGRIEI